MNNNGYRIVVDAGHGGSDPGAVSGNLREKDFTLKAANYMYNRFKELGVPVAITRDSDTTLSRAERLNTMRNTFGNDSKVLVLSNHINAGGGEGAEIVYPLRTSSTLPKMILEEIGNRGQIKRKIYQRVLPENPSKDYYYIMRETPNTTALLIEYGFIDNKNDQKKLENNLLDYVEGVVEAVSNYIGINYVPKQDDVNIIDSEYIVKSGDTLYSISKKYNVSIDDLIKENNLESTVLSINQVLSIPRNKSNLSYTVEKGDTLYKIANTYGTTVDKIKELNNLESDILSIGEILYIPEENNIEETDYMVYQVEKGDTLYSIAKKYNVLVNDLIAINNLSSNILYIGQNLQIPRDNIETNNIIYVVKPGDTLYRIANNYNVSVSDIMKLNNLETTLLSIGESIIIPNNNSDF